MEQRVSAAVTVRLAPALAAAALSALLHAAAPAQAATQAAGQAAPTAPQAAAPASSGAWPQTVTDGDRSFQVFAPQFETYAGDVAGLTHAVRRVRAGAAAADPADFGSMSVAAQVSPGANDGELELGAFQVQSLTFGGTPASQEDVAAIQRAIGSRAIWITRRALVHDMQVENARAAGAPGLGDFVPAFRVERRRATLISVDGDPVWKSLGDTGWRQVVNTPFLLLQAPDGSFVTRLGSSQWVGSASFGDGYAPVPAPPAAVIALIGSAPPPPVGASPPTGAAGAFGSGAPAVAMPAVVVVTEPTVLLSINGEPILADVAPGVQWVFNARCTILRTTDPAAWWTLASGRWFSAPALEGPWARVGPAALPASFAKLPGGRIFESAKASIPRTPESVVAVAAAQEERTVQIQRATARCGVSWRGAPMWRAIDGTLLRGSVNASQPVIQCDRAYYCCDNAVWFRADDPQGAWSLCDVLPDAISTIQAFSPYYPLTAVDVVGSTDDAVTFAYSPAYLGTYVDSGTVVFGSGADAPGTPLPDGSWITDPQTYGMQTEFDLDTGTFAPPTLNADQETQPALSPDVLVGGWVGWGWCPGWTSAWGWGWRNPAWWNHWGDWWRIWNPYWNRWANARTAAQRARDDAAAAALRERAREADAQQAADDQARQIDSDEAAWRDRAAAADQRAAESARQERAEEARLRDMRDADQRAADERARAARANQGPTAPRGSMTWWYEYANDYSHGYLTRATGYVDPRYGPMGSRGPSILDGPRGGYRSGFGAGAGPGTGATGAR